VLGEHGFVGLSLFLCLLVMTWLKCSSIIKFSRYDPDQNKWAGDIAAMIQVSLVAYMSAGTFLGLSYFDYIYHLIAIVVVVHYMVVVDPTRDVGARGSLPRVSQQDSRANASP
jgi:hypothetical protein